MIKYLLHKPIATSMAILAIIIVSIVSLCDIPISLMPDIDIPRITVQVEMPGASVNEIEKRAIAPIRQQLSQLEGLTSIQSDSKMDIGTICLQFVPGSNIDVAFVNVNEKIDMAMGSMPKEMKRPKVIKATSMDIPAFYLDISVKQESTLSNTNHKFSQLSDFTRDIIVRRFEQLPSTALIDVSGLATTEILCIPDLNTLQSLGLTESDLQKALADNNVQLEALSVKDGAYHYHIHFDSQLTTLEDIKKIIINHQGRIIPLGELCHIEEIPASPKNIIRHNGRNCITLAIIKQSDARMADLKNEVSDLIENLQKEYPTISFNLTRDQTELLSFSMNNLKYNLLAAIIMTCLVLIFFLRNWRVGILVAFSIPLSLLVTILSFKLTHITMNIISLSGLILGVGMIVDNSIVVIDNIIQKREEGLSLVEAIAIGTKEVFPSLLSSVLTTCSIFIPLIFIGGIAGTLFFDQSMGVTMALFASLLVSVTVIPIYFFWLHKKLGEKITKDTHSFNKLLKIHDRIESWVLRHSGYCMLAFLICIPGILITYLIIDKQMLPDIEYSDGMMHIDWNDNISVEESDRRTACLIAKYKNVITVSTEMTGTQDFLLSHTKDISSSESLTYLCCKNTSDYSKLKDSLMTSLQEEYPEATISFSPSGNLFNMIFSTDEPELQINLQTPLGTHPSFDESQAFIDSLRYHFPDVTFPSVVTEDNIQLVVNSEQIMAYGVTYEQLKNHITNLLGKNNVLQINHGSVSVPIIIGLNRKNRKDILESSIKNADGTDIPLNYLLKERKIRDYKHIYGNTNGDYYPIIVHATDSQIKEILDYISVKQKNMNNLVISTSGSYYSSREAMKHLIFILVISLLLLFFILAAQFESLITPLIILLEIPIDMFFVMAILFITGQTINMMSMIGFIVMGGIVINDSILKIDTINRYIKNGVSLIRALLLAGRNRLMPILMTSLTTIFSMLPFMTKGSIGADMQFSLSLVIIIGMIVGTLVSVFFVPLAYYLIHKNKLSR